MRPLLGGSEARLLLRSNYISNEDNGGLRPGRTILETDSKFASELSDNDNSREEMFAKL